MRLQTQKPSDTKGVLYDRVEIETNRCPVRLIAANGTILEVTEIDGGYFEIRPVDQGGFEQLVIKSYSPNVIMVKVDSYWRSADEQR